LFVFAELLFLEISEFVKDDIRVFRNDLTWVIDLGNY